MEYCALCLPLCCMECHLINFFIFYSGVDVLAILQTLGVGEAIIAPLKDSAAGYFAIALALYKLATPLRYAVTVGNIYF